MSNLDTSEECLSDRRDSKDRTLMRQTDFESLIINVKNLQTVISLLKCEELHIIVSTLTALSKFISKSLQNIAVLSEYHVLDDLMPLIEHEDLMIRRFATKLVAEMTVLDVTRNVLIAKHENCLHRFMDILHEESDAVVQEHLLQILCNFAEDIFATYKILESPHLNTLLIGLHSMDPEVRKYSLEMLDKLMANPTATERISSLEEFYFELFYEVHYEDEIIPELALSLIKQFLIPKEKEKIHREFRDSGGLEKLLEIFRNNLWEDLHTPIFELLVVATANYKTAEHFHSLLSFDEISEFFTMINDSGDPMVLQLLSNLSAIAEFRKIIHDLGIVQFISMNLNTEINPEIINPICSIIENICHLTTAMNKLIGADVTGRLIEILQAEQINWHMKEDVIFAIKELVTQNHRNGESIINSDHHLSLIKLAKIDSVPMHMRLGFLNVVNVLINLPKFRCFFMRSSIIEMLSSFFNDQAIDELEITSLSILSHLFVEEEAKNLCLRSNFFEKLCPLICTDQHSLPVQSCAIQLIQQLCCEATLIDEFVKFGYLNILLENRKIMRYVIPSWETCLETMLSGHLPLKFAITGHLSLHDVTKDGFYVVRRHCHSFPSLNELLASRCSPMECLYTINFSTQSIPPLLPEDSADGSVHWTKTFEDDNSSKICFSVTDSITCDEKFGRLRPDPSLCQNLQMFLRILQTRESIDTCSYDSPNLIDISKIESRAKLLAKFIAHTLSSVEESLSHQCMEYKLKNHIQELRESLETSIIPLGELRFGLHLERALLFKAIADRICLPVALIRGEYGKSWVEIAVPQSHETMSRNLLPTKLLCPNYIVDLMDNPGELISLDSNRARKFYEFQ